VSPRSSEASTHREGFGFASGTLVHAATCRVGARRTHLTHQKCPVGPRVPSLRKHLPSSWVSKRKIRKGRSGKEDQERKIRKGRSGKEDEERKIRKGRSEKEDQKDIAAVSWLARGDAAREGQCFGSRQPGQSVAVIFNLIFKPSSEGGVCVGARGSASAGIGVQSVRPPAPPSSASHSSAGERGDERAKALVTVGFLCRRSEGDRLPFWCQLGPELLFVAGFGDS